VLQPLLVEGEVGIGKSRVLAEVLRRARERGFRVFVGHADEIERARPFGPLVEALGCSRDADDPLRAEIARLLAGDAGSAERPLGTAGDPGLQFRVVDALADLVEELALSAPVALALEDLHWADASTMLALRSLARRLTYLPVALLVTLRPSPREADLARLLDLLTRERGHRLLLAPLEQEAVAALVAEMVAGEPSPALLDQVAGAGANPFFVTELVRALAEQDAIHVTGGRAELREASLPPSLRLTILRRISFLDEESLELLQMASLLGSSFSLRDVATVLDRPTAQLVAPLRPALRAGVVEEREAGLAFRHDLIREAIYQDLPGDVRAALHLDAGRRLGAAGAPALQVAEQLVLGAQPGDADAVERLQTAAREAAQRAPAIAVELLQRALELVDEGDERRIAVLSDLVPTLLWSGRTAGAEARAREGLAARVPPELEVRLRLDLVHALLAQGRPRQAIEEIDVASTRPSVPDDLRSQLAGEAAIAYGWVDDLDGSDRAAREAIAVGTSVHSRGIEQGLLVLSDNARVRGRLEEALALSRQALEHVEKRAEADRARPDAFVPRSLPLAKTLADLDRLGEALQAVNDGRQADERLGHVTFLPVYQYEAAIVLYDLAQWDDAVAQAEAGLAVADEVEHGAKRAWPYEVLARIAVHRGALDHAARLLAQIDAERQPAESLLTEARGDTAGAFPALADEWDRNEAVGAVAHRRLVGPDLVRLALAAGAHERAQRVADAVEEAAALARVPSLDGAALRCRGLVAGDADLLLRAVEAYRRSPRVFERALACEDAAAALARTGRRLEAKPIFEDALDVYAQVGARWDEARALASMRELGLGRRRRGARKRPARGWESLTRSELEVVQLAAQGLTNPEIGRRLFVSPRTVQTHLAHAFRKLGLSSRVELAAEAVRRSSG
jgi:DNA-binding CsgD family transcriptional regulator